MVFWNRFIQLDFCDTYRNLDNNTPIYIILDTIFVSEFVQNSRKMVLMRKTYQINLLKKKII